jgi:hypothetical protein
MRKKIEFQIQHLNSCNGDVVRLSMHAQPCMEASSQ